MVGAVWGSWGSCVGGAVCGSCLGELYRWWELCGGAVWEGLCGRGCVWELCRWVGGGCVAMHTSHQMVQAYTHHCLQYSQHKGDSPLPSHQLPPRPAHAPCLQHQQQPGSPLLCVPTSTTACSSVCATSSSLSR